MKNSKYVKGICLSFTVFVISVILIVNHSPNASGFETQGAKGPESFDLGLPVHQDITREGLYFLKPEPLDAIVNQHVVIEQDPSSPNHFDNCQFSETVDRINSRYEAAVVYLNPHKLDLPKAEERFGYILHAAQDFYSHTNWVEMGRSDLIDPWYGHWRSLTPYTESSNTHPVFILEEDGKPHSDFQIYRNDKIITVDHDTWEADGSGKKMGLISGTYDADVSKCPADASIPHGGSFSTVTDRIYEPESRQIPDELNKDNPARYGFTIARALAVEQTTHEFCRLADMVKTAYGDEGIRVLYDNWLQSQYAIDSPYNNSRCPTLSSTQVSLNQDSPNIERTSSSIPPWIKNNVRYWSDGQITDKEFATAIAYLVQQKIISANVTTNTDGTILVNDNLSIPTWVKNNAKWWSDGTISDTDFTSGIEYMVNQKIISFSEHTKKQGATSKDTAKSPNVGKQNQTHSVLDEIEPTQNQTHSVLDEIEEPTIHGLTQVNNTIQLESKHGIYQPEETTDLYIISASWVLKKQNGIEHTMAHIWVRDSYSADNDIETYVPIEDGVIQIQVPHRDSGTYILKILGIDRDNLPPPVDNEIEITIPDRWRTSTSPETTTVPSTGTPITQYTLDFSVPSQVIQEATSSAGAIVQFDTQFSSPGASGNVIVTCNPPSGSQFPIGNTVVTCTATDVQSQKTLQKSFTVTVRDTTPPAIAPFQPETGATDDSGAIVYFTISATDLVDGPVTPHCDHASGDKFPIGVSTITCTADDSRGNHGSRTLQITITKS